MKSAGVSEFPKLAVPDGVRPTEPVVAAVSGGSDSVALLRLLIFSGFKKVTLAHLEHGVRGEASLEDAEWVLGLAGELGCDVAVDRLSACAGASEETLRDARREFLRRTALRIGARVIFLGHHAGDQAETLTMNFFRGTGLRGLGGIRPLREDAEGLLWVRPLLRHGKADLEKFLEEIGQSWREDASNSLPAALRNRVRLELLPMVGRLFGREAEPALCRLAEIASGEEDWMEKTTAAFPLQAELSVRDLRDLHPALRRRVLRAWLVRHGISDVGFELVEAAGALLEPGAEVAKLNLPGGSHLRRTAGRLRVEGRAEFPAG